MTNNPRYIISAVGMPSDQCKEIEEQLNDDKRDSFVWVFDKPHQSVRISSKKCEFIISAVGMPSDEIKTLSEEINDNISDKRFWVVNKPITVSTLLEEFGEWN